MSEMTDEQYDRLIREALQDAQGNPIPGHYELGPEGRRWWVPDSGLSDAEINRRKQLYGRIKEGLEE